MSNLVRRQGTVWGEDELDVARKSGSQALVLEAEEKVRSRLRLWMRQKFELDANTREILLNANPAQEAKPFLLELLDDQVVEKELLGQVLDELLAELEKQRADDPGLYLIDSHSGKAIMRMRDEAVYQPPDYIGEDGIQRRAKPMLHPGIAAPLMMKAHEEGRLQSALERPGSLVALQVMQDPNSIIRAATEQLTRMGFEVGPVSVGSIEEVEIGREYYDPLQSTNDSFHRHSMFGAVLARKVADLMGQHKKCELSPAVLEKNSKQRWYRVTVRHA